MQLPAACAQPPPAPVEPTDAHAATAWSGQGRGAEAAPFAHLPSIPPHPLRYLDILPRNPPYTGTLYLVEHGSSLPFPPPRYSINPSTTPGTAHQVEQGASAAAFSLLFETCSAFGNVGLSLGYDYHVRDAVCPWSACAPSDCPPLATTHTPLATTHTSARALSAPCRPPISLPFGQASVDLLPLDSNWRTDLPRSGVGLSFSAGFPALAKAIVVLIMLYGRTRSLPQVLSFPDPLVTHIQGYAYMLL